MKKEGDIMYDKLNKITQEPVLIEGGLAIDDRGEVGFINKFDMKDVRRFYTVSNHKTGFVRGLLCFKCNLGLGYISTPELLLEAAKYLQNAAKRYIEEFKHAQM